MSSSISLKTFTDLAAGAANQEAGFLKVRGGRLTETGRLGNFFTTQATRRETISAFVSAVRAEYGGHIADMVVGGFTKVLEKEGKPLTARLVRDLTALAQDSQSKLIRHNRAVVEEFLSGADPANSLDSAIDALIVENGITSPDEEDAVRTWARRRAPELLLAKAGQPNFYPQSGAGPLTTQILAKAISRLAASFPGFSHAEQAAVMHQGLTGTPRDRLHLAAMGLGNENYITFYRAAAELGAIRALQPEGDISLETVYRALFKESPPEGHGGAALLKDIETRCEEEKQALMARAEVPQMQEVTIDNWAYSIPWDRLTALLDGRSAVNRDDVAYKCEKTYWNNPSRNNRPNVERLLLGDPYRCGVGQDASVPPPAFSFRLDETRTETIEVGPRTAFSFQNEADRKAYLKGNKNSLVDRLAELCDKICGDDPPEAQLTSVMLCLTQVATLPVKHTVPLAGANFFDEHVGVSVSLSRSSDGAVAAEFSSSPKLRDSRGQFRMTVSIARDGRMRLTDFELVPSLAVRKERGLEPAENHDLPVN